MIANNIFITEIQINSSTTDTELHSTAGDKGKYLLIA